MTHPLIRHLFSIYQHCPNFQTMSKYIIDQEAKGAIANTEIVAGIERGEALIASIATELEVYLNSRSHVHI